jgi:hypothetical protein
MYKKASRLLLIGILSMSSVVLLSSLSFQNTKTKPDKVKLIPIKTFKHTDIGNPAIAGTVTVDKGGFKITAGGADIWGVKDEFNFVYIEKTGDFDIVTRIESLSAPHLYTKAGIMARDDLTAGCRHIYFQVFPNNNPRNKNNGGYEFQYRQLNNGEMKAIYPASATGTPEFPVSYPNTWVRLQRINNEFTGYYSTDGKSWKVYTTYTLELPSKLYLGLAVTSHNAKESVSASFRETGEIKH